MLVTYQENSKGFLFYIHPVYELQAIKHGPVCWPAWYI